MGKKVCVAVLLAIFLLLVPATAGLAAPAGYQGASQWAVPELDKALQFGLITDSIRAQMNAPITREEFAEIAVKLYENGTGDIIEDIDTSVFLDTKNPEIFKAYELGIVSGTDAQKRLFSPHALISREQVAAMLYRTVDAMGFMRQGSIAFGVFMDSDQIAPYAREAVNYMSGNGFIMGSGGYINPTGTCTREMADLIATRVYEKTAGENHLPWTDEEDDYYYEEPDPGYYGDDPGYYDDEPYDDPSYGPMPPGNGDNGYSKPPGLADDDTDLPDSMVKIFPLLSDAQIFYMDEWDGGNGMVIYTSNYSIAKANEFYKDPNIYADFKELNELDLMTGPTIEVLTSGLQYVIHIGPNPYDKGGPTSVTLNVFWHQYIEDPIFKFY